MSIHDYKKTQNSALREFKQLRKSDPGKAREEALRNLHASGIVTKGGSIAKRYR